MIYNNPLSYGNDITPEMFAELADMENFVALKESSGNTRRITDLRNTVGDRYAIFTGVDDLVLESAILGIDGWVAGTGSLSRGRTSIFGISPGPENGRKRWNLSLVYAAAALGHALNLCSISSWPCRNAGSAPSGSVRRDCRSPAKNASACLA